MATAVLALAGCTRTVDGAASAPAEAAGWGSSQGAAVTVGGAGDVAAGITVFVDFQCPFCQRFEAEYGEDITKYVTEGRLRVTYRPVSFLDPISASGDYSSRAAASLFLIDKSGASDAVILGFIGEMFRRQPAEGIGNLTNLQISEIAAGAGVTGDVLREISSLQIADADHRRTAGNEQQLTDQGLGGVPSVVDGSGEIVDPSDPDWLARLVGAR
ncbi:DsbA family protein [Mycobacteroides sp. LB1]|uniref:DsbA family protein n=1 Tax=Mycobacteroides sp. LB1 TaxID=2750814 RepID=UPI0015DEFDAB|nr:thioredoxin domain-containing protein [Mycobacteroides sp. LB1]